MAISAAELKRQIPDVAVVARDLYGIDFRKGVARCPFPENHTRGDRDPSLRHDRKKNRLFCASQHCLGEKGVDAIDLVRRMDGCSFQDALRKLADHYGVQIPLSRHAAAQKRTDPVSQNSNAAGMGKLDSL